MGTDDRNYPMQSTTPFDSQPDEIIQQTVQTSDARDGNIFVPSDKTFDTSISNNTLNYLGNGSESMSGKQMILDDVRELSAKGDALLFEDLQPYFGGNASSSINHYLMCYYVEGGYRLIVRSGPSGKPDSVNLESVWEPGGSGIDIRYHNVDEFLSVNQSQDPITEEQARDIAQTRLTADLEPVSWFILGDWPESQDNDAVFARALLDSADAIGEACYVLCVKGTAEWGGQYYAVGKKSGDIYICDLTDNGKPVWH